ncbi:hypothetical protein FORC31_p282 (plasmid) [Escherichia coli]|nr:hypothetical protein FORC31_p282 [Escherichia coli]
MYLDAIIMATVSHCVRCIRTFVIIASNPWSAIDWYYCHCMNFIR